MSDLSASHSMPPTYEELLEQLQQTQRLTRQLEAEIAFAQHRMQEQQETISRLKSEEKKLREVQQLADAGYFISYSDHHPRRLVWSPEIYRQFGMDPAGPPPSREQYLAMIHPEDRNKNLAAIDDALAGQEVTLELRVVRKDDAMRYLKITLKPWRNGDNDIIGVYGGSVDVTNLKLTQQEINRNEALKKAVFNNSTDALLIVNMADRRILECNRATLSLFELANKQDLLGQQVDTLQRQPFNAVQLAEIRSELCAADQWTAEVEFATYTGRCFWGSLSISKMEVDGQNLAAVRISDITEKIKLRELLSKTQAIATIGGWEYDLSTQKITWTDEIYHIFGFEKGSELTLERIFQRCTDEHVTLIKNRFSHIIKHGGTSDCEIELTDTHHRPHWMRVIAIAHRENKWTLKLSGTLQNIDMQKRQELSLKSKQSQLRAFVEAAPAAIAMFDHHMCYIAASEKWYEDHRLLDQKILGESHYNIFPHLSQAWRDTFERCLHGAIERKEEDKNELPDGCEQWYKWEIRPWTDENGEPGGVVMFTEDISERKAQEEILILAKQKAEEASKTKAQFLSTMSHEIRTPMNAVIGMTHILLQEDPRPDQLENLQILRFSAENLLTLINDILDFSKIEAGKIELEEADFSLKELITGIKKSLEYKTREKLLELNVLIDNRIPDVLIGDATRLLQILNNLISNAIKFTEQGSVTIIAKVNHCHNGMANLYLGVKDTGIGIAKDKQNKIFDSFSQADAHITRKYGGTGLGLAITKRLLELHHTRIILESTPGEGSLFHFNIDFKINNTKPLVHLNDDYTNVTFESLKGHKILLVEDNTMNVMVAKRFLNKWELDFDHAENGRIATQMVTDHHYELVLMDLQMPEMDGYEATQQIRLSGSSVPIIALTASVMQETQEKIMESGMCDFVLKPFNPKELYAKICKHL